MYNYNETAADFIIKSKTKTVLKKTKNGIFYNTFSLNNFDFFTLNLYCNKCLLTKNTVKPFNENSKNANDIAISAADFINRRKAPGGILFIGLGNPEISADSLGFKAIQKLKNARNKNQILKEHGFLFLDIFAKTGIENSAFLKTVANEYTAFKNILLIDSLFTKNAVNLGALELSDYGLKNINRNTLFLTENTKYIKKTKNNPYPKIFGLGCALILKKEFEKETEKEVVKEVEKEAEKEVEIKEIENKNKKSTQSRTDNNYSGFNNYYNNYNNFNSALNNLLITFNDINKKTDYLSDIFLKTAQKIK